jgi:uncharacterized protein YdiU (UPF0061 family)
MPLIKESEPIVKALEHFKEQFPIETERVYSAKLGLPSRMHPQGEVKTAPDSNERVDCASHGAMSLAQELLQIMASQRVDHTILWRTLSQSVKALALKDPAPWLAVKELFLDPTSLDAWIHKYQSALQFQDTQASAQLMLSTNPKFVLRNHLGEIAIRQASQGDPSEIERLINLLSSPFDEHSEWESYADHPPEWAQSIEISCSS